MEALYDWEPPDNVEPTPIYDAVAADLNRDEEPWMPFGFFGPLHVGEFFRTTPLAWLISGGVVALLVVAVLVGVTA